MGPLQGIRIVEFAGIGPGPFAAMLLSDLGAEVIRIDRKGGRSPSKMEIYMRGRNAVALDMKHPEAVETALKLIDKADARRLFLDPLLRHLDEAGLGHISEVASGDAPHTPRRLEDGLLHVLPLSAHGSSAPSTRVSARGRSRSARPS